MRAGLFAMLLCGISTTTGCGQGEAASPSAGDSVLLSAPLEDAKGVATVLQESESGDVVSIVGRIGGSAEPFVNGVAAFTIVEPTLPYEETCTTPWDYCCQTDKLKDNTAFIKIVDAQGQPLAANARELLGVKELTTVMVSGKANRDKQGNLTVLAEKVHVVKE